MKILCRLSNYTKYLMYLKMISRNSIIKFIVKFFSAEKLIDIKW